MIDLKRLRQKLKYNSILRILHDGIVKLGIKISPFYLVEEGLHLIPLLNGLDGLRDYTIELLSEDDIEQISCIPEKTYKKEILIKRMKKGCACLLVKQNNFVVGYTWFDISKNPVEGFNFSLKDNEAYLFDAYTLMEYRGKGIAPFIRYQSYKELEKIGRTRLYSISEILNKQSVSFKKKLNAKFILLGLYIRFLGKKPHLITLKNIGSKEKHVPARNF